MKKKEKKKEVESSELIVVVFHLFQFYVNFMLCHLRFVYSDLTLKGVDPSFSAILLPFLTTICGRENSMCYHCDAGGSYGQRFFLILSTILYLLNSVAWILSVREALFSESFHMLLNFTVVSSVSLSQIG